MTKKIRIILSSLCSLLFASSAFSQSGTVATGGDASGTGGSVSYSVGQIDYQTESGNSGVITQGLQQPYEISIISGLADLNILLTATVYPNPTIGFVTLNITDFESQKMSYSLFTINGKRIEQEDLSSSRTDIDMAGLADGTYFLKVRNGIQEVKTFKIIKNK